MSQHRDAPARPLYDHIEDLRVRKGWSKIRLAREADVDRGTLENWKKQPRRPTAEAVIAVADALDIDQELALRLAGYLQREDEKDARIAALERENAELQRELEQIQEGQRKERERRGQEERRETM